MDNLMREAMAHAAAFAEEAQKKFDYEDQKKIDDEAFLAGSRQFRPTHKVVILFEDPDTGNVLQLVNSESGETFIFQDVFKAQRHMANVIEPSMHEHCHYVNYEQPEQQKH